MGSDSLWDQGMRLSHALRLTPVNPNCDGADGDNDGDGQKYERGEHRRLHAARCTPCLKIDYPFGRQLGIGQPLKSSPALKIALGFLHQFAGQEGGR
jgi:hypothetical protein